MPGAVFGLKPSRHVTLTERDAGWIDGCCVLRFLQGFQLSHIAHVGSGGISCAGVGHGTVWCVCACCLVQYRAIARSIEGARMYEVLVESRENHMNLSVSQP